MVQVQSFDIDINEALTSADLTASLLKDNNLEWDRVLSEVDYFPVAYHRSSLSYLLAYQLGFSGVWQDISLIIYSDRTPVAVWPISISERDGAKSISSHGVPLLPPLLVANISIATEKKIIKNCFTFLDILLEKFKISSLISSCGFVNKQSISRWHMEALLRGSECRVAYNSYLDLGPDIDIIRSGFRKSYRPLITKGNKIWDVRVMDVPDLQVWREFMHLHQKVAGRVTRVDRTWEIHLQDIAEDRGFLVYLLDKSGAMEGAGFFNRTKDEGFYAVAAYNRELFDLPLGHVVQFHAVIHLKMKGVKWYNIGQRPFQSDMPPPSAKEIAIADFKQGFSSHVVPRYIIEIKRKS